MNKQEAIKEILDQIQSTEGEKFQYEEEALFETLKKQADNQSSLSIKLLSILGGLLASGTFVAFLGIAGLFNSEVVLFLFGISSIGVAIWLDNAYDKLSTDTLSVSIFFIGFLLMLAGLAQMKVDANIISIIFILASVGALFFTQNYILSFLSILVICGSFLAFIPINEAYQSLHIYTIIMALILSYVMLNEARLITINKKLAALYDPARIALIISFLFALIGLGKRHLIPLSIDYNWVTTLGLFLITAYVIWNIFDLLGIQQLRIKIIVYLLSIAIAITTAYAPAIMGAILVMLLCFWVNHKTGLAFGVIALTYFVGQYYYDLNLTLLTKSIILFVSGWLFLGLYWMTRTSDKGFARTIRSDKGPARTTRSGR